MTMDRPRIVDLDMQNRWLGGFDHLERFGGRFRFVLARLYRITRELVVSLLTDAGDIQTDRTDEELFAAAAARHPVYAEDLRILGGLRAFGDPDIPDPFDPNTVEQVRVARLRNMVIGLLGMAYQARSYSRVVR